MPVRIQRKRTKGWRKPEGALYVGRPTKWGNPYSVGVHGTAQECVDKYRKWLMPYSHATGNLVDFMLSEANILEAQTELRGKDLCCFCPLDQPCHADVLLEIANIDNRPGED